MGRVRCISQRTNIELLQDLEHAGDRVDAFLQVALVARDPSGFDLPDTRAAMEELRMLPSQTTPAPVLMVQFVAERLGDYQKMARTLRAEGIGVEVYPDGKKIGQQLQYAEKRGHRS